MCAEPVDKAALHASYLYSEGFGNSRGPYFIPAWIDLVRVTLLQRQAPAVSLCPRTAPVETQGILVNEVLSVKMKRSFI